MRESSSTIILILPSQRIQDIDASHRGLRIFVSLILRPWRN
jgi:hypothetical protein